MGYPRFGVIELETLVDSTLPKAFTIRTEVCPSLIEASERHTFVTDHKPTMRSLSLLSLLLSGLATTSAAPNLRKRFDDGGNPSLEARCASSETCTATCPAPVDVPVEAPKPNPFKALSGEEIASVVSWLMADKSLNLTDVDSETLSLSDNYIAHIEALKPNKTDVVSYLDCNGTVPRYARVVLNQGAHDPPTVSEYFVSSSLFLRDPCRG